MKRFLLLAALAVCLGFVALRASGVRAATPTPQAPTTADEAAHAVHANAIGSLPVAVDGAKEPEKIPMDLAYRHFISALAGPRSEEDESEDVIDRRRTHSKRMGLSDEDQAALVAAVRGLGDELNGIERAQRSATTGGNGTIDLAALRSQERDLLDGARVRIGLGLSADGAARLEEYVQEHVRKRITIFGELPR